MVKTVHVIRIMPTVEIRGYPRNALAMHRVDTFSPTAWSRYPIRKATQSIMRDLFLPMKSATEFDTSPDTICEMNHELSEKRDVELLS